MDNLIGKSVTFTGYNSVNIPSGVSGKVFETRQDLKTFQTRYFILLDFPMIKYLDVYYKDIDINAIDMMHPVYEFITYVECDRGDFTIERKKR